MKTTIIDSTGQPLVAVVVEPEANKPYPLVILLHGNTGWKEERHIETLADELLRKGIGSIRFDAPGSGESYGSWDVEYRATNYIQATKDVYDWAVENLEIDVQNIGIWGHSMGGMVAVQAAAKWPVFAALCGSQPSTGAGRLGGDQEEVSGRQIETEIFGSVWLSKEFFLDRMQYDTPATTADIHIPQLYIAGTNDDLVPAREVQDIFQNANEPKVYQEFETTHMYKDDPENLKKINQLTTEFFVKNLL